MKRDEHGLTPRQRRVLELYAEEGSQVIVAQLLGVQPRVIHWHLEGIRKLWGQDNTPQLIKLAFRRKILQ